MELLLDTDFIVKMGRYSLLTAFQDHVTARSHAQPYRYLYEVRSMVNSGSADPTRSVFGSQAAWSAVRSFIADCQTMGDPQSYDVLEELDHITGIDAGEQLLVEYAIRTPDAVIVTADKRFIDGMSLPGAQKYRAMLKNKIIHLEHVIFAIGTVTGWPPIRDVVTANPKCDTALHGLLCHPKSEPDAVADLFASTKDLNRRGFGTVPAPI